MKRRPARAKMMAELFETFMAILHSVSHRSRWLRYYCWYLTSSTGVRDVAMMAVSSA